MLPAPPGLGRFGPRPPANDYRFGPGALRASLAIYVYIYVYLFVIALVIAWGINPSSCVGQVSPRISRSGTSVPRGRTTTRGTPPAIRSMAKVPSPCTNSSARRGRAGRYHAQGTTLPYRLRPPPPSLRSVGRHLGPRRALSGGIATTPRCSDGPVRRGQPLSRRNGSEPRRPPPRGQGTECPLRQPI